MKETNCKIRLMIGSVALILAGVLVSCILLQTWNLPKLLTKLMTKICLDILKYVRISEKMKKI